jgi:DNA-binding IclR family transcriptional regulator
LAREQNSEGQLGRALDLLLAVAELGLSDARSIAEHAGLPLSTTYRLLSMLIAKGFLQRRDTNYEIGWAPYFLANVAAASVSLPHRAWPILKALSAQVGETALAASRTGDHFVIISICEASKELRTTFPLGTHLPINAGAAGQIFIAYDDAVPRGDQTVREQGYALSDEDVAPGVRAIAAPVFDFLGDLACVIVVAGPKSRIEFTEPMITATTAAAAELSGLLGFGARPIATDGIAHDEVSPVPSVPVGDGRRLPKTRRD